jgi:hypothetical protein
MAFEVFEKGSAPVSTVPAATVQKRGLISLNRAAFELIGSPEAVLLLWDAERRVIGIQATQVSSPNAYPARPQSKDSSRGPVLIAGNLFTRYIGLDTTEAHRWQPRLEDDILCIDLNEPGQRVVSNRNRAKEAPEQ